MFETHDHARLTSSLVFSPDAGMHRWAYVAQSSNHEWFFATHETVDEEGNKQQQQFMIPFASYLLGFAAKDSSEAFISQIQLVSPPWLNESGSWLMERIREIRLVNRQFCYVMANGNLYPSSLVSEPGKIVWSGAR
ncbi:TPA: hypothetical protein ACRMXN_005029 [Pseudomonas aeruginosa]|uniref:hypothetical protein n=1 Tax=Pseudomonas aeruginosa TaxID=287 RepID=UPI000F845D13|nr:hypothetical protein [Pseudomonas aeruginosa]MBG4156475.1 hypothetical protein [Pseudomonas aeruginosa]MBG4168771.1 hypothetical protein [Pseudomonas aeruginosa]MBG4487281.1 hypothetical protein [Pseudomonas aeruginosa]MBG4499696.1 hypothetical protein [Pseudomonas aeruginosa]RTR70080.1 hypothetical protein DY933_28725 [Pseudomonas aeruginosa]